MKRIIVFFLIVSFRFSFGQGEGAITSLTLQQSPLLLGAGRIGAAIPTNDVLGFYYNPAILGYSSKENHFAFQFMPEKTKYFSFQTLNSYGFNLGYNFKSKNLPLSIGFGYLRNVVDYGSFVVTDSTMKEIGSYIPEDSFNSFSIGAGYTYFLNFNIGFSIKSFNSNLGGQYINGKIKEFEANGTAYDFGAMIITPFSKLFLNDIKYDLDTDWYLTPDVNFTLGYSLMNLGKKVFYIDPAQADPLPRTARLGYTFDLGMDMYLYGTKINSFDYSFTAEAGGVLIKYNSLGQFEYQSFIGDINIGRNLIELKNSDNISVHRGHIFRFFESFIITSGRETSSGSSNIKTYGFGITSEGIFKILSSSIGNSYLKYFLNHFTISYFDSNVSYNNFNELSFKGVSLYFKDFELNI